MMEACVIRKLGPNEVDSAFEVFWRSLDDSIRWLRPEQRHTQAQTREFFTRVVTTRCEVWVAERQGRILGVLAMQGDEVDRLYVDLPTQRQGVGSALLEHAKALCPQGLKLVTLTGNTRACRFYEHHGFVAYEWGTSPAPECEPDVWYRWPGLAE